MDHLQEQRLARKRKEPRKGTDSKAAMSSEAGAGVTGYEHYALSGFICRVKGGALCRSSTGCRERGPFAGAAPGQEAQEVQEGGEQ